MLLENISLGKTLEIYVDREGYRYRLVSKVEDTNARRICVSAIVANGRAFLFRPEDDIKIVYRDEDHMWEWTKVKAGLAKLDGSPVHYFEITNKGRSFNRRNAYRVNVDADVKVEFYDIPGSKEKSALVPLVEEEYEVAAGQKTENGTEISTPESSSSSEESLGQREVLMEKRVRLVPQPDAVLHKVSGMVKNISETGMGLYCDFNFQENDGFCVQIPSTYGPLEVKASVIRVAELDARREKYRYYYGCIYSESDKKLIRYIYDIQRKTIQKKREQRSWANEAKSAARLRQKQQGGDQK